MVSRPMPAGLKLAVDLGPLLVFFIANSLADIYVATGAFMAAIVVAMVVSKVKTGAISTMLWVSGVLVLAFGALTIYLQDDRFIKVKPTIVYLLFASALTFGLVTRRPLLKLVLETGFPAMTDAGWTKLSRNWALFFLGMALLNEIVWRNVSTDTWVQFKVWGVTLMSFVFVYTQLPLIQRHSAEPSAGQPPVPPPQG